MNKFEPEAGKTEFKIEMNKVFIKITAHEGVFLDDGYGLTPLDDMLFNLSTVEKIIFNSETERTEIKNSITFHPANPGNNMLSICFNQEGIGEYQRLERSIEELVI